MRLSRRIVSKIVPDYSESANPRVRARVGLLEGWVSVAVNVALFAVKMALGLVSGSVSLIADAVHTLSDSLTSVVVIFGFRLSAEPADEKHPFGHGRMESIAAVVIGVLLGLMAVEMLKAAVLRLLNPRPLRADFWIIAVLVGTLILKELLSRFSHDLGALIGSDVLHADARHHRSDVLATGLVIVAFLGARWNLAWLDGAMGIGVAGLIGWAAWTTMGDAVGPLLGMKAPEEMYQEIDAIARSSPEVLGVHDILVHRYGSTNIVSLHIEVAALESPMHLHAIGDEIEERIARRFRGHAIVHVDPLNSDHEHYAAVSRIVEEMMAEADGVTSFHDLRVLGSGERLKAVFDVATDGGMGERAARDLRGKIESRLREKFPRARVVIAVEPPYFRSVRRRPRDPVAEDSGPE